MVDPPTGHELAALLGAEDDPTFLPIAEAAIRAVSQVAWAYTRGNGFDIPGQKVAEDVGAVILMGAARYANNPEANVREEWDDHSVLMTPFTGWTLAEQVVLNRYRRRAL